MALTIMPTPSAAVIRSIQAFSIAISSSSASNTATLGTSVTTAKSMILRDGVSGGASTNIREALVTTELTDSTTVTATRAGGTYNNPATVKGYVVEYY